MTCIDADMCIHMHMKQLWCEDIHTACVHVLACVCVHVCMCVCVLCAGFELKAASEGCTDWII